MLGDDGRAALTVVDEPVLARFTPEFCDAVLGREDSACDDRPASTLEHVPGPLDAHGEWTAITICSAGFCS